MSRRLIPFCVVALKSVITIVFLFIGGAAFASECPFGGLCDKTVVMSIPATRLCLNDKCENPVVPRQHGALIYFSPDGFLMTQFRLGTPLAPGMTTDTFVCRASPVPVEESEEACKAATCKNLDLERNIRYPMKAKTTCSFQTSGSTTQISFNRAVKEFRSANDFFDTTVIISAKVFGVDGSDCGATLEGNQEKSQGLSNGQTLKTSVTFAASSERTGVFHQCESEPGIRLVSERFANGRIVDPGSPGVHSTYPPLNQGQKIYIIPQSEALGNPGEVLDIPDDVTLKVAPDVTSIDWTIRKIRFGKNAIIDLSAPTEKPAPGANAPGPMRQAEYCIPGRNGADGSGGQSGRSGASLTIKGIEEVEAQGSLWIRTDGGPGADGGHGQDGQQGGGPEKRLLEPHFECKAARGGVAGSGGPGGNGGPTSAITLRFYDYDTGNITFNVGSLCGSSSSPNRKIGGITIWGQPGCGGGGGGGGHGGKGGEATVGDWPDAPHGVDGLTGGRGDIKLERLFN